MNELKRLPDAEFEVMQAIWDSEPPVTTPLLMEKLGNARGWQIQALITLLSRLETRGFIRSKKEGKLRLYSPLIKKEEYLRFETESFIKRVHGNSLGSLVASMSDGSLSPESVNELLEWARSLQKE